MADLPKVEAARINAACSGKKKRSKVAPKRKKVKRYIEVNGDGQDLSLWRHV